MNIESKEFADKVIMPKPKPVRDEYPTDEQITLILNCAGPNVRAFVMLLCDTGHGRSEAARLRPKDIHFNEEPVRIETERHKTGEQIETFCTRKTADTIQQLIASKKLNDTDLIFLRSLGKRSADKIAEQYAKILAKAGLDEKIEGHAYRKYHLHVYRKRWFTKAINVVPAYVAHAMLGRKQYLDQYLAHPLSDRQAFYKKIAKHVSVFESKADKAELLAEASKIAGVELTPEKLEAIRALTTQFAKMPTADLQQITKLLSKEK
jgi:integrase